MIPTIGPFFYRVTRMSHASEMPMIEEVLKLYLLELNLNCDTHIWNDINNESMSSGQHLHRTTLLLKLPIIHFSFKRQIEGVSMF